MMEVSVHRVTNIKMERREYEAFNTVRVTVTDSDGLVTNLLLFSNDETPIQIGEEN